MKRIKEIIYLGLILLAVGIASGCTGTDTEKNSGMDDNVRNTPNILSTPELHYRTSEIPIPAGFKPFAVRFMQREVYLFDGQNLLVIDQEGKEIRRTELSENESYITMDLQSDRSVWILSQIFKDDMQGAIPDKLFFFAFCTGWKRDYPGGGGWLAIRWK